MPKSPISKALHLELAELVLDLACLLEALWIEQELERLMQEDEQ